MIPRVIGNFVPSVRPVSYPSKDLGIFQVLGHDVNAILEIISDGKLRETIEYGIITWIPE